MVYSLALLITDPSKEVSVYLLPATLSWLERCKLAELSCKPPQLFIYIALCLNWQANVRSREELLINFQRRQTAIMEYIKCTGAG